MSHKVSFDPLSHRIPGGHTYKGMVLEKCMSESQAREVEQLQFEPDDIVIASYPKTGTTLLQELVYLIRHNGDTVKAGKEPVHVRVPFLEANHGGKKNELRDKVQRTEHPRTFKTHFNFDASKNFVLAQKIRVLYIMRNPKDTLVSMFYFYKLNKGLGNFPGTWNQFFDMALANFDGLILGNMFDHFLGWWQYRHLSNVLIVRFEDLVRNRKHEITRIAEFCGKADISEEVLERIAHATSFDVMKNNDKTNYQNSPFFDQSISPFLRKGQIGDWKNHFTIAQNEIFDKMIKEKLGGSGLEFCYDYE